MSKTSSTSRRAFRVVRAKTGLGLFATKLIRRGTFIIRYTDGTTQALTQSISDWHTPQSYPGESTAISMAYRDTSSGGRDARPFYIYGYTFALNAAKAVQSLTMPGSNNGSGFPAASVPDAASRHRPEVAAFAAA
jgi:hypothetical protein